MDLGVGLVQEAAHAARLLRQQMDRSGQGPELVPEHRGQDRHQEHQHFEHLEG